jgi:hypothetical protein
VRRYSGAPKFGPGIEGVRIDDCRAGNRQVVDFILRRINQASGAEPTDEG